MTHIVDHGRSRLCACIGPTYGEPYCPCEMERRGLPPSDERIQKIQEAKKELNRLFGPFGEYHRKQDFVIDDCKGE